MVFGTFHSLFMLSIVVLARIQETQKQNYTVTFDKHDSVLKQWVVKEDHNYKASQK